MKRFLNIIMVISACMVSAVSCKEEDNVVSEFSIDKTEIAVGADGGSELLEIKGNVKWQGTSESSWLKFSPSNGEGAATCEVLVDSSVVAEPREGVITFMAAGQTTATTVKVMQMGYAKGVFVSEEDRTISVENSAKLEERFFEVTMMANVNFDVRVNNLPAEDGTVSDKEWLKYKKETPNYDYGDRPRLLKLHFDWEINMTEKARTAEVIITPQETSDTEGDGTIKLVVTQKPAPVITDDRAGDSLALLSIYSSMNGIFTWDASENMRYWKGVELWEATDKYIKIEANGTINYSASVPEYLIGRLKSVEFIAFETKESLPYQVKYLKTAESITFSGNSNTFLKDIVLGNEICELVQYGHLRNLAIRAYGLVGLPENFTEFGKTLVSLDLSSNNFEVMGKSGSTINGVKVLGIESITRENFPYLRNLYLNKINRYDTTKDLSAYKGKDDKLGFRWTTGYGGDGFPGPSDGYDNTYFKELLQWENLEYLSLSLNMLDGELPSDEELRQLLGDKVVYEEADIAEYKDSISIDDAKKYLLKGGGAPKVWPRMKKLSLNLNFMNGKLPDWILYHPYLSFWDPFTMIFQQELSTTSSKAKNTKGEVITKFSNEPTNLSNYGFEDDGITRKMSYYEMYPKRKPQITDESEEGN
ncbi:BACON domain-containing protein [Phocaeicola plebeius]|uniref:BACON domain-containing protein n=1 Tax=Phocaeicola plebeius TaxID=310297 RepID=UPI003078FD71